MRSANNRYPLLRSLESPADLRRLTVRQLPTLATELRSFLRCNDATPAEHLPEGLAAVELAIALHYVFDTPADRIVWDSGHQAWPHKVLTGRRDRLHTAGQHGGMQPFCTAIGGALGMAVAAAQLAGRQRAVAVVGDSALSAGMAFEALNHAGSLPADLLVVLNDTDPATSGRGSALSNQLAQVLSGRMYTRLRDRGKKVLRQMPTVRELARRSEQHLKGMVLPGTMFEELGFNYIGPVDGHNVAALVATLRNLRRLRGPQFLHVLTRKPEAQVAEPRPRGPAPAAVTGRRSARNLQPGEATAGFSYSEVFGEWLCDSAAADPTLIAITPAEALAGGLREFARRFPQRCFDVSSAQQHAVTFAAGLAAEGFKPVVAISSTFLQRAYDQLIHDVALQGLPVMFAVDHAGLVDGEGATPHGAYDLSYLRCVPNLTIMAPSNENECRQMLCTARALPGPTAVRYPCGRGPGVPVAASMSALPLGRAQVCREGRRGLALLVFGALLDGARIAAERLDATLVNMRFVKPLDEEVLASLCRSQQALVTIEDNALAGGAGTGVAESLALRGLHIPLLRFGIPDRFIGHGSRATCLAAAGLDAESIGNSIESWWHALSPERARAAAGG